MIGNHAAGSPDSIHVAGGGAVQYVLPAPLAHYVDSARDGLWTLDYERQPSLALGVGAHFSDYPRACAAGVYGDSEATAAQSSALCSGLCPVAKLVEGGFLVAPQSQGPIRRIRLWYAMFSSLYG